jgi:hypothetical protein
MAVCFGARAGTTSSAMRRWISIPVRRWISPSERPTRCSNLDHQSRRRGNRLMLTEHGMEDS